MISKKKDQQRTDSGPSAVASPISQSILEVETPKESSNEDTKESSDSNETSGGETKVIKM